MSIKNIITKKVYELFKTSKKMKKMKILAQLATIFISKIRFLSSTEWVQKYLLTSYFLDQNVFQLLQRQYDVGPKMEFFVSINFLDSAKIILRPFSAY